MFSKPHINSFTLSSQGLPKRISERPIQLRQDNFNELYDNDTLIYDVINNDGKVIFICPPLTKEAEDHLVKNIFVNNKAILKYKIKRYRSNKVYKYIIKNIKNNILSVFNTRIIFAESYSSQHDTSRVLYTLQKNNSLEWIKEWVKYSYHKHKPTLVIIYDNSSTSYSMNQLEETINSLGYCPCIVRDFPFKYGPGAHSGSYWDSDYCQYAAFEHARYLLSSKSLFLNTDIDEILIHNKPITIFDRLSQSKYDALYFKGRWVHIERDDNKQKAITFSNHNIQDKEAICPTKYITNLNKLNDSSFLQVHSVLNNTNHATLENTEYLHFRNISNNWKYKRDGLIPYNPEKHNKKDISYLFQN